MKHTNKLADIFNWLGEVFEKFNPAAFRFLAALLPYLTPLPVAFISQANATKFLNLKPGVSGIFVFCLEGIGLWFTSLFVDAVVEAIRSKNWKAWLNVLMFAVAVTSYVVILININVIIEQSSGRVDPAYSRLITLLCFLPLITGIGNGYYKLKLEQKTNTEIAQERELEQQDKIRQENNDLKLKKAALKHGFNPFAPQPVVTLQQEAPQVKTEEHQASDYRDFVFELLDTYNGQIPLTKITEEVNRQKRVRFVHEKVKGTWYKYLQAWKRSHP